MNTTYWLERWRTNEIGFHMERPHHSLVRFYHQAKRASDRAVFVPLCGKSPDLLWLREQGAHVIGVEISPLAVEAFFREQDRPFQTFSSAPFVHYFAEGFDIFCGDYFELSTEKLAGARFAYDRGSLVALPADFRSRYATHLAGLLPEGSRVLCISYHYPQQEIPGPPFSVPLEEISALFADTFEVELLARENVLWSHERLKERGVSQLHELVLLLERC